MQRLALRHATPRLALPASWLHRNVVSARPIAQLTPGRANNTWVLFFSHRIERLEGVGGRVILGLGSTVLP